MTIRVIMDGQFGSCGKGAVISVLSQLERPQIVVRAGGPQAGHSMLGPCPEGCNGHTEFENARHGMGHWLPVYQHVYKMRQIPAAWHSGATCVIGRGAYVDLDVLEEEIRLINSAMGYAFTLWVDPEAVIVEARHRQAERADSFGINGSTREGVGVARAHHAMRSVTRIGDLIGLAGYEWLQPYIHPTAAHLRNLARAGAAIWIEGTQGYGLSLRASGLYPYVTSADITPMQLLADVGLHFDNAPVETMLLLRTFPIRIAGNSGPLDEIGWDSLPVPPEKPEITTVTLKQRRIGNFDWKQVEQAVDECSPTGLVLTFMDYLKDTDRDDFISMVQDRYDVPVAFVSDGFESLHTVTDGVFSGQVTSDTQG